MVNDDFSRHALLGSDVENYSARTEVDQHELQQSLAGVYEEAAQDAGLDRSRWAIQPAGDGELAVLPASESLLRVIDKFPGALSDALAAHNSTARPALRMRMRLALHEGLSRTAAGGFAGSGVVAVSRMAESHVGRRALHACPEANLVVLLSSMLYREYVTQGHTNLTPGELREVEVSVKNFLGAAWLYLPGHNVHALELGTEPAGSEGGAETPEPAVAAQHPTISTTVHGDFHGDGHVFGASYGPRP